MRKCKIKIDLENSENLFSDNAEKIAKVIEFAVREAVISHKRLGNSIAVWKDGKPVVLRAEEIVLKK